MRFSPGNLVLFKHKAAVVRAVNAEKLDIAVEGGADKSVRPKDIVFLHAGPVSAVPPALLPHPDCAELAELMESETFPFGEFLELAYSENSASAAWSAWHLLEEDVFFAGTPEEGVRAKSKAAVEEKLASLRARQEEADARAQLIERLHHGAPDPETDRGAIREIEQIANGQLESSRLMRDLGMEAAPDAAHRLLLKLHCWDDLADPFPARAGIELANPDFPLDELADDVRRDMTGMEAYAIDDVGSMDPDDAIAFADGLLYVHVADPGAALLPDSPMDMEARSRGGNLYLPTGITHMLPEAATERFGLGLQETSPAWTFVLDWEENGRPVLKEFFPSTVRVSRHDYDSAGPLLAGPLAPAAAVLERFKAFRKEQGALFIRMPEVKVQVRNGEISVTPIEFNPVRETVAHAMLAAGAAIGRYAAEQGVAMPFVIQPPAEMDAPPEEDASMPTMYAARRACAPGTLSPWPGRHSGLGLEPYVRVTSPLRRYEDLLAHRQLRRIFRGEMPLAAEAMENAFASAEEGAILRSKLERQVNEFYKIVWFQRHPDWRGECVALQNIEGGRTACMIPEFAYEFKTRYGNGELMPGEHYPIELELAEPVTLTCRFRFS